MMQATEAASGATPVAWIAGEERKFASNYRFDRVTASAMRSCFSIGKAATSLSTFAEANAEVYSDGAYMGHYVNGLLMDAGALAQPRRHVRDVPNAVLGSAKRPFD